ncbi:helix-turn-helix transcriptional regulator [Nocardia sp. NPDC004860]|uniref:helix-turn-helix transcriptional regulator n=1 Tax=Nocardia sp. NPDC004860 TaxID=3154557 RepID=UPI0033B6A228
MSVEAARKAFDTLVVLDHDLRQVMHLGMRSHSATTLPEAIAQSAETTAAALSAAPAGSSPVDLTRARLTAASLGAQSDARHLLYAARSRQASAIPRSITRMRDAGSIGALVRRTCSELVSALDFRCATYSIIDAVGYSVQHVHSGSPTWQPYSPQRRFSPEEHRCVTQRQSAIVAGTVADPATSMAALLGATDYLVAPVVIRSEVRALIHAARDLPFAVDSADTTLLDIITSAFAVVYEREVRTDRMQHQQQAIFAAARQLIADAESCAAEELDLGIGIAASAEPTPPMRPALRELLTPREAQVLKLIVVGASNNEIADRLVITVETVKSHVKKVLRKLGAVNRAEAISLYLDDQDS